MYMLRIPCCEAVPGLSDVYFIASLASRYVYTAIVVFIITLLLQGGFMFDSVIHTVGYS
jgi:hypothetical protein